MRSFGVACVATLAAMLVQQAVRNTWQVRSLPERTMETLLILVPLDLFERGLQQFGANAKDIALVGTYLGMAALLLLAGWQLLTRTENALACLALGVGLWLVAMLVMLPLTGAGPFGAALLVSPLLTAAAFACVFASYAAVLALGAAFLRWEPGSAVNPERRSLLAGLGGTLATILAFGVGRYAATTGASASSLPLAAVPTSRPAQSPTPVATQAVASAATPAPTAVAATAPTAQATATPGAETFPTPAPVRAVSRDQEGSLTAAGRKPGTLAPPITSNQDFYIVTKNAVGDPVLDAADWRLIIDGEVDHPVQLDYATLLALPSVTVTKTLECISNLTAGCDMAPFGCDLMSTATWRGVAVKDILDLAGGVKSGVVDVAFLATDEFSAGLPVDVALDPDTLIVYQMNGDVLPREHGYPARLLVPGRYGMKNPKWLAGIRPLNQPYVDWYQQRGWTRTGEVKTMSRIDMPVDKAMLTTGSQSVAGVAYAGDRGITGVEISSDGGMTWTPAMLLEPPAGTDAMVRWQATFEMGNAPLTLVVRATDGTGVVQPEDFGLPAPDGSWGQDSIDVVPA